jgi:hypothetical protein
MNVQRSIMTCALGLGMCQAGFAQAPAGAPAGSTGVCKDGSYTTAASKSGACRGHKGVQTWFAAGASTAKPATTPPAPATAAPAAPTPTAAAPQAATPKAAKPTAATNVAQAPGGGPGMVWVNTASGVYHVQGSKYYGKTKQGKYMSEADEQKAGYHVAKGETK